MQEYLQQTQELVHKALMESPENQTRFNEFLKHNSENFYDRTNMNGHITGSMFVLNKERDSVLLMHHKKLNKWLQMGGHWDEKESCLQTAEREMFEEGFGDKVVEHTLIVNVPVDIDIHWVGNHEHYDICFLTSVKDNTIEINAESHELKWVKLTEVESNHDLYDDRVRRMASKAIHLVQASELKQIHIKKIKP